MREMISVALPMMLSMSCDTVMTFTDRLFLSSLGEAEMNASLGGGIASFTIATFVIGLLGYTNAMVAQRLGAGRKSECSKVVTQGVILALAFWPILIAIAPLMEILFERSGLDPKQMELQLKYFYILVMGWGIGLVRNVLAGFFTGIGKTRIVMLASIAAMFANVILNYILIFGNFGFPKMGIVGAAIGTISGGAIGLLILIFAYLKNENRNEFSVNKSFKFDLKVLKELVRFGSPSGFEMFLNLIAWNFVVILFQSQNAVSATASTIVLNWDNVSFVPLVGIEVGVMSLVGRSIGARDFKMANKMTHAGMKLGLGFSFMVLIAFITIPEILVRVFEPDAMTSVFQQAFPLAVIMLRSASIYVMIEGVLLVYSGALRGAGDTFWTMCITVGVHWILALGSWIVFKVLGLGTLAGWYTLIGLFMLFPLLLWLRWRWLNKSYISGKKVPVLEN